MIKCFVEGIYFLLCLCLLLVPTQTLLQVRNFTQVHPDFGGGIANLLEQYNQVSVSHSEGKGLLTVHSHLQMCLNDLIVGKCTQQARRLLTTASWGGMKFESQIVCLKSAMRSVPG